jgi:hypothetical protein
MPEGKLGVIAPTGWTELLEKFAERLVDGVERDQPWVAILQSREREQDEQRFVRSALVTARPDVDGAELGEEGIASELGHAPANRSQFRTSFKAS